MPEPKMILKCSVAEEKRFKKAFKDLVVHFSQAKEIEASYPCCLPVFRCTDMQRVAGVKGLQSVVSYSTKCFSPANHQRIGTLYGNSYSELENTIQSLRGLEDLSVG